MRSKTNQLIIQLIMTSQEREFKSISKFLSINFVSLGNTFLSFLTEKKKLLTSFYCVGFNTHPPITILINLEKIMPLTYLITSQQMMNLPLCILFYLWFFV